MPGEEEQLKHWNYVLLTSTGKYGCKCGLMLMLRMDRIMLCIVWIVYL